jgi:Glycosyl transferase family 11
MKKISKPVIVGLSGGLGNQLFQYAAGRSLSLKLGVDLILDKSWFQGRTDRIYALEPFSINAQTYSGPKFFTNWMKRLECRISRRWATKRLDVQIYREPHFEFDKKFQLLDNPVYLEGYWQSELYFVQYKEIISKELTLSVNTSDDFKELEKKIHSTDAICVHVRRGDYVTNQIAQEMHGLCSIDYLYQGIKEVSKGLTSPHCFVFSDDYDWVKKNLSLNISMTLVDIASPNEAYLDLILMNKCKHFVIANSSFSWWGAWLAPYEFKRVIAPLRWFAENKKNTKDLIPPEWLRI